MTMRTASFVDLPLECLPLIFKNIPRSDDLAACSRTNRRFQSFATPILYQWVYIYSWAKNGKDKVIKLFETLSTKPDLAKYVLILELREFPHLSSNSDQLDAFFDTFVQGLRNCTNVRTIGLTRDGSCNLQVLQTLQMQCGALRDLEINGRIEPHFDAAELLDFKQLNRVSLIMPDRSLVKKLQEWTGILQTSLKSLSLVDKDNRSILNENLVEMGDHLRNLTSLQLVGLPRVSHVGILGVVSKALNLESLSLDGLDPAFDMQTFADEVRLTGSLNRLTTLSVHFPSLSGHSPAFNSLIQAVESSPLESFTILGAERSNSNDPQIPYEFVRKLVQDHGHRLKKFAVQRAEIGYEAIELIGKSCPQMEQLFLALGNCDELALGVYLAPLSNIHTLHFSYSLSASNPITYEQIDRVLWIVRKLPTTLKLIGFMTKVLEIQRTWVVRSRLPDGTVDWRPEPGIKLPQYRGTQIPEAFLVK